MFIFKSLISIKNLLSVLNKSNQIKVIIFTILYFCYKCKLKIIDIQLLMYFQNKTTYTLVLN